MKTYRNRLYSIPDAAKRAGITEKELRTLMFTNAIKCDRQFGSHFIWGGEIPKIKSEWEKYKEANNVKVNSD